MSESQARIPGVIASERARRRLQVSGCAGDAALAGRVRAGNK